MHDRGGTLQVESFRVRPKQRTTLSRPGLRMTVRSDNARCAYLDELVASIMARPGPLRLVAVDGPGGAGKSTFAYELSEAADGAPVIHTDDFAAADNPISWWPRLLEQVIEPFARGDAARYQRYDWPSETLAEWHAIEPAPIVIIEGVSAGRSEWAAHLSFLIWIDTPCGSASAVGSNVTASQHSTTGVVDGRRGRSLRT